MASTQFRFKPWHNISLRAKSVLVVVLPLLILLIAVFLVWWSTRFTANAEDNLQRSIRALSGIHAVHAQVAEAASGVRGYIYTRDPSFLQPYWLAERQIPNALQNLQQSVKDPIQTDLVAEISRLVRIKMQNLDRIRKEAALDQNLKLQKVLVDEKVLLDVLREKIAQTELREQELILQNTVRANQLRQRHLLIAISAAAMGIFAAIGLSWWFANGLVQRVRAIGENAKRLEQGQTQLQIQPSADELGQLAARIHTAGNLLAARAEEAHIARFEAEEANQAKTAFLSRMSHELRTPLNAILGFAQLLERDLRGTPKQRSIELILSSGHHLLQLVNDVLDISRIESGHIELSLSKINLNDLIYETLAMNQAQADANKIQLHFYAPSEPVWVLADRQRLLQVLLNLLSNAIKYNHTAGQVWLTLEPEDSAHWRLNVADTGVGISAELEKRLFSPFARDPQNRVEGTGLGLAVSQNLMHAMNGHLGWQARQPEGSIFWLRLPRDLEPQHDRT